MQPLKAITLHPERRSLGDAGHKVKGATHTDGDIGWKLGQMLVNPDILARVAIGDQEDMGTDCIEVCLNRWPILFGRAATVGAENDEGWKQLTKSRCSCFGDAGCGSL